MLALVAAEAGDGDLPVTRRSVPGRAVESFAQEIRVAVVPCVFLDHVEVDPAQVHVDLSARMEEGLVQSPAPGGFPGKFNLPPEGGEVLLRIGFIDVIELPVGISLAGVEDAHVLSRDAAAKPHALDVGHVTDEPKQRQARRVSRPLPELSGSQATALAQQRLAVKIQPRLQHLPLTGDVRRVVTDDLRRSPRHAPSMQVRDLMTNSIGTSPSTIGQGRLSHRSSRGY